jgi:hypothetical protein
MTRKRWLRVAIIVCVELGVLLWPFSYLSSPRWEVLVVDKEGKPRVGANVRLEYTNYSAENASHELTLQTDENGRVEFPDTQGRANLMARAFHTALAARKGIHASFGRHASVFVFGHDGEYEGSAVENGYDVNWQGSPRSMRSRIVVR